VASSKISSDGFLIKIRVRATNWTFAHAQIFAAIKDLGIKPPGKVVHDLKKTRSLRRRQNTGIIDISFVDNRAEEIFAQGPAGK